MKTYQKIYEAVKLIPKGKVATYGMIASMAGINSPRLVGKALHNNPQEDKIPCHRVVNASGRVAKTFAFGGENKQEEKLISEGVFIKNHKINLSEFLWK